MQSLFVNRGGLQRYEVQTDREKKVVDRIGDRTYVCKYVATNFVASQHLSKTVRLDGENAREESWQHLPEEAFHCPLLLRACAGALEHCSSFRSASDAFYSYVAAMGAFAEAAAAAVQDEMWIDPQRAAIT